MEKDVHRISTYLTSFVLALLFTSSFTFGQDLEQQISFPFKRVSLKTLLDYINKENKIEFSYVIEALPLDSTVVISDKNISLSRLLNETLKKLNLEYEVISGIVVVRKKDFVSSKYLKISTELEGLVLDSNTEKPLASANVYFSNTSCGTFTNQLGFFDLKDPPKNATTLVVSYLGYETLIQNLNYKIGRHTRFLIKLKPLVRQLDEVTISGKRDKTWFENIERFKKEFLGSSANAEFCSLLNPEVLKLQKENGRLKITANEPLKIENKALGYLLTVVIEKGTMDDSQYSFVFHTRFDSLQPEDSREKIQWETNRLFSFLGSEKHLFESIINRQFLEEGFEIYKKRYEGKLIVTPGAIRVIESNYSSPITQIDSILLGGESKNIRVLKKGKYRIHQIFDSKKDAIRKYFSISIFRN
jgi:hypothetical protein